MKKFLLSLTLCLALSGCIEPYDTLFTGTTWERQLLSTSSYHVIEFNLDATCITYYRTGAETKKENPQKWGYFSPSPIDKNFTIYNLNTSEPVAKGFWGKYSESGIEFIVLEAFDPDGGNQYGTYLRKQSKK